MNVGKHICVQRLLLSLSLIFNRSNAFMNFNLLVKIPQLGPKLLNQKRISMVSESSSTIYDQIKARSNIWIDSSDIESISQLSNQGLQHVTTNPSLVWSAISSNKYDNLLNRALKKCQMPDDLYETVAAEFGAEILKHVPGWVCSQLDIQNADDAFLTVFRARQMVERYEALGIPKERVLVKLASTWEGIEAAATLEQEGIRCLMTLTVSEVQARAAADAGASMIATYVGRVSDWHRANEERSEPYPAEEDPGVKLTTNIQSYYREHGYKTEVMAASFRSVDQIAALAGCDHLTIAPKLIEELLQSKASVELGLGFDQGVAPSQSSVSNTDAEDLEALFRGDPCAVSVYDQSFQGFLQDTRSVRTLFNKKASLS